MKNKQEELTLLDTLSQVDKSLTQQAYDVDSAKKFHALGKSKVIAKKQEKPTRLEQGRGVKGHFSDTKLYVVLVFFQTFVKIHIL